MTRYFIVFYEGAYGGGFMPLMHINGNYPSIPICAENISKQYGSPCRVTNIIELNDQDYKDAIQK